jgi:hypothetical protein
MRVGVTIGTLAVAEAVTDGLLATANTLSAVTGRASQIGVRAFERIGRHLGVVEGFDLERLGHVARIALALWLGEAELARVDVAMTTRTLARSAAIGRAMTAKSISLRRSMTAVARGFGVCAGQRPYAMVDSGRVPPTLGVAVRTTTGPHLRRELITVRVLVTVGTNHGSELEVGAGPLAYMAARARHRLMPPPQRKARPCVLLDRERRRPKPMLVVAARAIGLAECPSMGVTVTVVALVELELPISSLRGELGRVTAFARDAPM